jgi:hypothetical protein
MASYRCSFKSVGEPNSLRESDWSTFDKRHHQSSQARGDVLCSERSDCPRAGLDFNNEAISRQQSACDLEFGKRRWWGFAPFGNDYQRGLDELKKLLDLDPFPDVIFRGKQQQRIGRDVIPVYVIPLGAR